MMNRVNWRDLSLAFAWNSARYAFCADWPSYKLSVDAIACAASVRVPARRQVSWLQVLTSRFSGYRRELVVRF